MIPAPLLMMPRGFVKDERKVDARDAQGRRILHVHKRDQAHGGRWGGVETYKPDTSNDATIKPVTVTVTLRAADFGMTKHELARVLTRCPILNAPPKTSPSGLILP